VFLFFFLEETNYHREAPINPESKADSGSNSPSAAFEGTITSATSEKMPEATDGAVSEVKPGITVQGVYSKKDIS